MPWGGETRSTCKLCGEPRQPGEIFSARGKHLDCGDNARRANAIQLHQHQGPFFEKWRRAMAACVGGVLLDDQPPSAQTAD